MVRHVVMWKFHEQADGRPKAENLGLARDALQALADKIPGIVEWEVGVNAVESPEAFDLVLVSLFESLDCLAVYQTHPEHLKVVAFLRKVRLHRSVVDSVTAV